MHAVVGALVVAWFTAVAPSSPRDGGTARPEDLSPLVSFLSTGDGGLPFAKYKWEVPDRSSAIDVPVVQVVNGLPVRFSAAVSRAKPDFLLKYYVDEFTKAGLYIPPEEHQMDLGGPLVQLTALDTDNLISYSVILQVTDDKHTTVIMGQGYLTNWLEKKPEGADVVPLFPGARNTVHTHSEGLDVVQYSLKADAAPVRNFYDSTLRRGGFSVDAADPSTFVRGSERITVSVVKSAPGSDTSVVVRRHLSAKQP